MFDIFYSESTIRIGHTCCVDIRSTWSASKVDMSTTAVCKRCCYCFLLACFLSSKHKDMMDGCVDQPFETKSRSQTWRLRHRRRDCEPGIPCSDVEICFERVRLDRKTGSRKENGRCLLTRVVSQGAVVALQRYVSALWASRTFARCSQRCRYFTGTYTTANVVPMRARSQGKEARSRAGLLDLGQTEREVIPPNHSRESVILLSEITE